MSLNEQNNTILLTNNTISIEFINIEKYGKYTILYDNLGTFLLYLNEHMQGILITNGNEYYVNDHKNLLTRLSKNNHQTRPRSKSI